MLRYNVYLANDKVRFLRELKEEDVSVSEHIRRALEEYVAKKKKEVKVSMSLSRRGGVSNVKGK